MRIRFRNKIFLIFTLLITVPFLVIAFLIPNWFSSLIKQQTENNTLEMMEQYSIYLENVASQVEDVGKQVLVNRITQDWLATEDVSDDLSTLHFARNEMNELLTTTTLNSTNHLNISVYLDEEIESRGASFSDWYPAYLDHNERWTGAHINENLPPNSKEFNNSFIFPLYEVSTLKPFGIIKVNIPTTILESALDKIKIGNGGRVHLLNGNGENVLAGQTTITKEVIDKSLSEIQQKDEETGFIEISSEGNDHIVFFQNVPIGDWTLIGEITSSELFAGVNEIQRRLLYTAAVIFILTIITTFILSSNIVRPLVNMSHSMKFLEKGDFESAKKSMPDSKNRRDEVGYLMSSFKETIDRLDTLIKKDYESNIRRKDAEYKALLLQINPHFLNNTLEIISGLAALGKNEEVVNVSVYLGRMMSYSLNTQDPLVTLGQELEYIKNFTEILKMRYRNAITIEIEEDPQAKAILINRFVIQPLVENAAKFSFIDKNQATIAIRTKKERNQLFITIEDDGIGIEDDVLKDLLHLEHEHANSILTSKGTSIGLKNVIGRLKLHYGDDFTYSIETNKNQGTKITLCIKVKGDIHDA
ncbi:histidine kinase [Bacillus gibsonii]|nr:histidine kinase [Alkalicoccobacillus gibsonii]